MSVKHLKPYKQGSLDYACGIYSVVNAFTLIDPKLPPERVFNAAIESYRQSHDLNSLFNDGMTLGKLKNVVSRVRDQINDYGDLLDYEGYGEYKLSTSIPFWQAEPDRSDFLEAVSDVDYKNGKVAIISYDYQSDSAGYCYSHWTVIKNITDKNIMVHDSDQNSGRIPFDGVRIGNKQKYSSSRPWRIHPRELIIIEKVLLE